MKTNENCVRIKKVIEGEEIESQRHLICLPFILLKTKEKMLSILLKNKESFVMKMELIYLYIKKYENIFENVEFNFSSNYVATLKNSQLVVRENKEAIKKYYGANVNSVVMFLGKNGMGKSTLLDILGMTRKDRSNDTYVNQARDRRIKSSYFILYHLYDDYFAFEFVDDSFIKGKEKIDNIDMLGESVGSALYKKPMGNIFKLQNGVFTYSGNIILQWLKRRNIKSKIEYAYITSDRYNSRISNDYRNSEVEYLFERKYYLEENNYEYLYKYLVYLKEINNEELEQKTIRVKNIVEVDTYLFNREHEIGDYLYDRKRELDKLFGMKSDLEKQMEEVLGKIEQKKDNRNIKEIFLQTLYAEIIEYYFLEQLVGWSESNGKMVDVNTPIPDTHDLELEIDSLDLDERKEVNEGLMEIMNFQAEYAFLLWKIKKMTDEDGNIDMKSVLQYILTRVEVAAKNITNIYDKETVMKIFGLLEEVPEHYFASKKSIKIECGAKETDEKIIELLRYYDCCYRIRNSEDGSNNIFRLLNIEMPQMSEGQRVFIDIIAKTMNAIYATNIGDSLVLLIDEPDRALHPELSRRFLDTLLENVNKCEGRNLQIVLTSHSPFVVTDILPENVYSIEMKDKIRQIRNNKDTYATNIYYLLMDSFMLNNTFGEYSYKQLKKIMKLLNDKADDEQLEWIKKIIDRIGEKTVKKKMLQLYGRHHNDKTELVEMLQNEIDEEKIKRVREILEKND